MPKLSFLLLLIFLLPSCKQDVHYEYADAVYKSGDDLQRAKKDSFTKDWINEPPTKSEVFWARVEVKIRDRDNRDSIPLGLQIHSFGSFDVYWDGVFLGKNGQFAKDKVHEIPGSEASNFIVPDSLARSGLHSLALRSSQHYSPHEIRNIDVKLQYYKRMIERPLIAMSFMNLMAGAFLIASLYYFFLYINSSGRELNILIFGVICLLFFMLLIAEYIKFYITIPYNHFYVRLEIIGWLTFSIALLVPFYFTLQFYFKHKFWLLGVELVLLIYIYIYNFRHYDWTAMLFSYTMWFTTLIIVVNALFNRVKGAWVVLFCFLVSAVIASFIVYDFVLFICFTLIVLSMLYLHSIRTKLLEKEHQSSILLSSRLKLELLKKNIQPHFIKNTLTSMIDWIEESPKDGVIFIQALAKEFDILNEIADQTLIPIATEIELCKTHLEVMQFRKEINYQWEQFNIDEMDLIPPAIIHTILENGITHSMPTHEGKIIFKLSFEKTNNYKEYKLLTMARNRKKVKDKNAGTGFQYIAARLTESYDQNWTFESNAIPEGWLTSIKIATRI
ncbi:histidine kinase [Pedobacter nototheniae]|uniref:histidine kinase n=1 Tax=Pedobacter nototheniae TaxID=2488994 RepID=UPI00292D2448|nr:histidine kinase [Pedobacter nototheniae]